MVKPPSLPANFLDFPVAPAEAKAAEAATATTGSRLQLALDIFTGVNVLGLLSSVVGAFWLQGHWPELLAGWERGLNIPAQELQVPQGSVPSWFWLALGLLGALAAAVNIWAFSVVKGAVRAVGQWALAPRQLGNLGAGQMGSAAQDTRSRLLGLRPWLTFAQWWPVIVTVLSLGTVLATLGLTTQGSQDSTDGLFMTLGLLPSVLPMIVYAVLNTLFWGALKRWGDAVITRTAQVNFPVQPFARSLDGWLVFGIVILILNVISVLFSGFAMMLLPSFVESVAAAGETSKPTPESKAAIATLSQMMSHLGWLMVFSGAVYILLALCTHWLRLFTRGVAQLLDSKRPAQAVQADQPTETQEW